MNFKLILIWSHNLSLLVLLGDCCFIAKLEGSKKCVCQVSTKLRVSDFYLSGGGNISTNHKVNIRSPLLVHLLKRPVKAECGRRRIYLSCSNWLIVAVLRGDWVVHHVRLRAADGGGAAAKRAKLPLIRCKGLEALEVAVAVFIEKSTDWELICFSEPNGQRRPPGDGASQK